MQRFELLVATDLAAALRAGAVGHTYKAGGVDLMDRLKERIAAPDKLVSVAAVPELRRISQDAAGLHIGATATLAQVAADPNVRSGFGALARALGETATPQVRNMATIGGNLCQRPRCWYFRAAHYHCLKKGGASCFAVGGEHEEHALFGGGPCNIIHPSNAAPALVAAGALLQLHHRDGMRRIEAQKFFVLPRQNLAHENVLRPGELLVGITIPKLPERAGYSEVRHKQSFDWPLATAAAVLLDGRWSIVLGAVAPTPWRSQPAEAVLADVKGVPTEAQIAAAAKAAVKGAIPLPRAKWRLELVSAVVRRALMDAIGKREER